MNADQTHTKTPGEHKTRKRLALALASGSQSSRRGNQATKNAEPGGLMLTVCGLSQADHSEARRSQAGCLLFPVVNPVIGERSEKNDPYSNPGHDSGIAGSV